MVSFAGLKMHFYLYHYRLIWRSFVESFADDHGFILLHKSIFSSEGCLNPFDYTTCFDAKNSFLRYSVGFTFDSNLKF